VKLRVQLAPIATPLRHVPVLAAKSEPFGPLMEILDTTEEGQRDMDMFHKTPRCGHEILRAISRLLATSPSGKRGQIGSPKAKNWRAGGSRRPSWHSKTKLAF
jgi:hypothetical protein